MTTEIKYQIYRVDGSDSSYPIGTLFNSELSAKNYALNIRKAHEQEYKIVSIITTTTTSTLDIFSVPAHVPKWEEVAANLSAVYAQPVDWEDQEYLALSPEDQAKVHEYVEHATDDCENCGWTFEAHYLGFTDHGNICDRCEADLAEEDESDE